MKVIVLGVLVLFVFSSIGFAANDTYKECAVKASYYRRYCLQSTLQAKDFVTCMKRGLVNMAHENQNLCRSYVTDISDLCNKVPQNPEASYECYIKKIDFDLSN